MAEFSVCYPSNLNAKMTIVSKCSFVKICDDKKFNSIDCFTSKRKQKTWRFNVTFNIKIAHIGMETGAKHVKRLSSNRTTRAADDVVERPMSGE